MRILVLSNLYPPHYLGGYELACHDVVNGLRDKGHDVAVLTSTHGAGGRTIQNHVYRWLYLHWYNEPWLPLWRLAWTQFQNARDLAYLIKMLAPDLIYVWGMNRLELSLADILSASLDNPLQEDRESWHTPPVVLAISDQWLLGVDPEYQHWIDYWKHRPRNSFKRIFKPLIQHWVSRYVSTTPLPSHIQYAHFFSRSLQQQYTDAGVVCHNYRVIYHGIPVSQRRRRKHDIGSSYQGQGVRLLYSGRIDSIKGVHTTIEALSIMVSQKKITDIRLTIIGPQPYAEYVMSLRNQIEAYQLQQFVTIRDKVQREELTHVYASHDFLLFPSIWEEPFSITILEAMAHGLVVISTPTGGSAEILRHKENSMIFQPEDASGLANQIETLLGNPTLIEYLRANALKTVQSQYSLETMLTNIEQYLSEILQECHRKPEE